MLTGPWGYMFAGVALALRPSCWREFVARCPSAAAPPVSSVSLPGVEAGGAFALSASVLSVKDRDDVADADAARCMPMDALAAAPYFPFYGRAGT